MAGHIAGGGGHSPRTLNFQQQAFAQSLVAKCQVEQPAEDRERHNDNHPGQLVGWVFILADEKDHQTEAQNLKQHIEDGKMLDQTQNKDHQHCNLDKDQEGDDSHLAEQEIENRFDVQLSLMHKNTSKNGRMDLRTRIQIPPQRLSCCGGKAGILQDIITWLRTICNQRSGIMAAEIPVIGAHIVDRAGRFPTKQTLGFRAVRIGGCDVARAAGRDAIGHLPPARLFKRPDDL